MEGTIDNYFPSKYLKAEDIAQDTKVTIENVTEEDIMKERKLVVHFAELDKGVVLNKTNAHSIAKIVNSKTFSEWSGQTVVLYKADVPYRGDIVSAIRFKAPA